MCWALQKAAVLQQPAGSWGTVAIPGEEGGDAPQEPHLIAKTTLLWVGQSSLSCVGLCASIAAGTAVAWMLLGCRTGLLPSACFFSPWEESLHAAKRGLHPASGCRRSSTSAVLSPWELQGWSVERSLDVVPVSKAAPGTNPLPNPREASCTPAL